MPRRTTDPYANYNFRLEIDGITKAGFTECTGLNAECNVIEYREGDESLVMRKLPGLLKFGNVTLKRGVSSDPELFNWFKTVSDGDITRDESMSIVLLDEKRQEAVRWNLRNAWPAKWTGPDLKGNANEIAIESLELAHEGVERQ
ncbi:MAG: phage tail protein [Acidobacteria bacterium]|nr:MAG: phage tail protein [Acidobacteriota bacterium]